MKAEYKLSLLAIISLLVLSFSVFANVSPEYGYLRTNLYILDPDGTHVLMDGTLTQYDSTFSNDLDGYDARKLSNSSVNFGMLRNSVLLIIERRACIGESDTIFFKMWGMGQYHYQLDLIGYNLNKPGMTGILEDKYLGTKTPLDLNDSTKFRFTITADPASKAQDRFRIIFTRDKIDSTPLTFERLKVFPLDELVVVNWKSVSDFGIRKYVIERSGNNLNFKPLSELPVSAPATTSSYSWIDKHPMPGTNYYRIEAVDDHNHPVRSETIKVLEPVTHSGITLRYSPAGGGMMQIHIEDPKAGNYQASFYSASGQMLGKATIPHPGGISNRLLEIPSGCARGIYILNVQGPGGMRKIQQFAR